MSLAASKRRTTSASLPSVAAAQATARLGGRRWRAAGDGTVWRGRGGSRVGELLAITLARATASMGDERQRSLEASPLAGVESVFADQAISNAAAGSLGMHHSYRIRKKRGWPTPANLPCLARHRLDPAWYYTGRTVPGPALSPRAGTAWPLYLTACQARLRARQPIWSICS